MARISKREQVEIFVKKQIDKAVFSMVKYPAATDAELNKMTCGQIANMAHEYHRGRKDRYEDALAEFRRLIYR